MLTLTQSIPDGQGLFAIDIERLTSSTYKFMPMGIAERYGLFAVALSTLFDSDFVVSNSPIASNYTSDVNNIQTFNFINQSKYFGYWDDRNGDEIPNPVDNYGWVKITRTISGLTASSSATAIGSGIIVGSLTQVPVPVPAALWLFGSGILGMASFSKKRKNEE
jgi:hypothetical protein